MFSYILGTIWQILGGLARDLRKTSKSALFSRGLGAHLGAKMRQVGAKMAPSWPTWRQDVPKIANLEAKMANLAHFWEHLGDFFWILGAILPKPAKTKKMTTVQHFWRVYGGPGAALGGYLGPSWRYVGLCWAILAPSRGYLGASWHAMATR